MADLVINNISYQRMSYDSLSGGSWYYKFTIEIKNIGKRNTNDSFFISNTRSVLDYDTQYFTHGSLCNSNYQTIKSGQSLIEELYSSIPIESIYVLFKIAAMGDKSIGGTALPYADESNYENNYYTLELSYD